jgi:hypothetical protein
MRPGRTRNQHLGRLPLQLQCCSDPGGKRGCWHSVGPTRSGHLADPPYSPLSRWSALMMSPVTASPTPLRYPIQYLATQTAPAQTAIRSPIRALCIAHVTGPAETRASRLAPIWHARTPPPLAQPIAPKRLMPTVAAGLVSQPERLRGAELERMILLWVRRRLY